MFSLGLELPTHCALLTILFVGDGAFCPDEQENKGTGEVEAGIGPRGSLSHVWGPAPSEVRTQYRPAEYGASYGSSSGWRGAIAPDKARIESQEYLLVLRPLCGSLLFETGEIKGACLSGQ